MIVCCSIRDKLFPASTTAPELKSDLKFNLLRKRACGWDRVRVWVRSVVVVSHWLNDIQTNKRNACVSTGNSSSSEAKLRWKDGRGFNSAQRPLLIPLNRLLNFWCWSDEFLKQARTRKVISTVRGYLYPVHRTPTDDPIYGGGNGQGEGT